MTKPNRPNDLVDLYGIEWQARQMRAEVVAGLIRSAGRAVKRAVHTLDMWFEGARQLNAVNPNTLAGMTTRRYHIPALFGGDPERVVVKPANENDRQAAA
jgi:hypothetical protein